MTDPNAFTLGLIAGTFAGFLIALAVCHVADRVVESYDEDLWK